MTPCIYECPHCYKPAFGVKHMPRFGDRALRFNLEHMDGRPFSDGEEVRCESCGKTVGPCRSQVKMREDATLKEDE